MKTYKVYFNNEYNTWKLLNEGYLYFPDYKREQYNKRNEFNNQFFQNLISGNKIPCINTFCDNETEKSLFFFLDLFDAIEYISYHSSKFGNFNNIQSEYKILELELPDELILKYLGVGNYEIEKEYTYNLALEVAIPFDELQKSIQSPIYNREIIQLDDVVIYDANDSNIVRILEYLRTNLNYKSQSYMQCIEHILHILGFEIILGTMYKSLATGKLKFIQDNPQYKSILLSEMLMKSSNEIDKNLRKYNLVKK